MSVYVNLENEINQDDGNQDDGDDGVDDKIHDNKYVPSVSGSKKTSQSLLTVEEDDALHNASKKLVKSSKPIFMKEVAEVIKKNTKLCHLLRNFTHRQLADRVCSMRKAMLREKERKSLKKERK